MFSAARARESARIRGSARARVSEWLDGRVATAQDTADTIFLILEVAGTAVFAVSGVMAAARSRMDWLGGVVLGMAVAVGGGTVRDMVIGELPVNWVVEPWPLAVAAGTSAAAIGVLRWRPTLQMDRWTPVLVMDAVGLGVFVVLGAAVALQAGQASSIAVLMGVLTGVGGGVIRDIFTGRRPLILVGQIYALAGAVGAILYVWLVEYGVRPAYAVWLPIAAVIALRVAAIRWNWHLPLITLASRGSAG